MKFKFRDKEIDLSGAPAICATLNITPDSFSDGGKFLEPGRALERALAMEEEGADIIDAGAASSRPGAMPFPVEEEKSRLIPVLKNLKKRIKIPLSVDTCRPETAKAALGEGADIINDITGLREENGMAGLISESSAGVIIMHMQGTPDSMQKNPSYADAVFEIKQFLEGRINRALSAGIPPENIAIDPGIGFGKKTVHNLEIINSLDEFQRLGYPVFIGVSRKSVIGDVLSVPVDERIEGTAALVACSVLKGADIIRVHDVKFMKRVALMARAVRKEQKPVLSCPGPD